MLPIHLFNFNWIKIDSIFIFDKITPKDDVTSIVSHKKFLLMPINPPTFDIIVLKSIVISDFVTPTSFVNQMINPFSSLSPYVWPISFAWYIFALHGIKHLPGLCSLREALKKKPFYYWHSSLRIFFISLANVRMWRTKSLQNFSPGVTCSPTLSLALLLQVKQVDSTVEAGAQFQQVRLLLLSVIELYSQQC